MLFNSPEFVVFLPLVFTLFWLLRDQWQRNVFLLLASYIFYGWWEPRFLILIVLSSAVDFSIGWALGHTARVRRRRILLAISLCANLGMLGLFKYYGFFIESFGEGMRALGFQVNDSSLNLILPVGISFYTFQTLSYTIDVYRRKLEPCRDIVVFFTFVAFFPQLVAGPIERAVNLLGQFKRRAVFRYEDGQEGLRRILFGLFKKVVIADQCGIAVNHIFANYESLSGSTLALGTVYFAFQIYGDFSGYSDIAIGTARLFGIELMENFKTPYFSRDPAEFWRRWHRSLSTWFRDYLYIPLGGSQGGTRKTVRNTLIVFLVSGLWHGANWTFVVWGFLHWLFFLPLLILGRNRRHVDSMEDSKRSLPTPTEFGQMLVTFSLICVAWVFFRAENVGVAFGYLAGIFDRTLYSWPNLRQPLQWVAVLVLWEWMQRRRKHAADISHFPVVVRWGLYLLTAIMILANFEDDSEFIYFQF